MTHRLNLHALRPSLAAVAAAALLSSCTDGSSAEEPERTTPTSAAADGTVAAQPATPVTLTVTSDGWELDVADVEPGWIALTVRNDSKAPVEAAIMRVPDGGTLDDLTALIARSGAAAPAAGEPGLTVASGLSMLAPGTEHTIRTEVFTGAYGIGRADGSGGRMVRLDVGEGDPPLNDPPTDAHVLIQDFSYVFDEAMRQPGLRELTVTSDGPSLHELRLFRVLDGVEPGVALEALRTAPAAPAIATTEVEPVLGIGPATSPSLTITELDLTAGTYVAACFLPNDAGQRHAGLGMVAQLVVAP